MRIAFVILTAAFTLGGCASHQVISAQDKQAMRGKLVIRSTPDREHFMAMTAANSMPGASDNAKMLGEIIAARQGNSLVITNQVPDPALQISVSLADSLRTLYGTRTVPEPITISSKESYAKAQAAATYMLSVRTYEWGTQWGLYDYVVYQAHASITNIHTKDLVAKAFCRTNTARRPEHLTYNALAANQAALLKRELEWLTQECLTQLRKQMFGTQ